MESKFILSVVSQVAQVLRDLHPDADVAIKPQFITDVLSQSFLPEVMSMTSDQLIAAMELWELSRASMREENEMLRLEMEASYG